MELFKGIIKDYDKTLLDGKQCVLMTLTTPTSPNEYVHELAARDTKTGQIYLLSERTNNLVADQKKSIQAKEQALKEVKELADSLKLPREDTETMNFVFQAYETQLKDELLGLE